MHYLALTVLSSVLVSVILKINESRDGNRLVVAGTNYVVAAALALLFAESRELDIGTVWIAVSMAAGGGFIGGFLIMMMGLKEIGLAIPTSAARLSMLVPVVGSIVFFDERPSALQLAGIGAGVAAFALLGLAQRTREGAHRSRLDLRAVGILVAVFAIVGTTDFTMKAVQSMGVNKDAMAFYIFGTAAVCCWIAALVRRALVGRARAVWREMALGALLGVPNYFSVYFLLLALRGLDASVVFPAVSAGAVVTITIVAVVFWRERPNGIAWFGIALAAIAVVLLGLQQGGS